MTAHPTAVTEALKGLTQTNTAPQPAADTGAASFDLAAERAARDAVICAHYAAGSSHTETAAMFGLSKSTTKKIWLRSATAEQRARRSRTVLIGDTT